MPRIKLTTQEFIEKANKVHNHKYLYTTTVYENASSKLKIVCTKHGEFEQTATSHLSGRGCRLCNCSIPTHDEILQKIKNIHGDKLDLSKVKYKNNRTNVEVKCNICDYEFSPRPSNLLAGHGCPNCAKNISKGIEWFINESKNIYGSIYDYSKTVYKSMNHDVEIFCTIHNKYFSVRAGHHLNGTTCELCKVTGSFAERQISLFLTEHDIEFVKEKRFIDCRNKNPLPFDFYIESLNLCIEFDGKQHYESVDLWGGIDKLKYTQNNDSIKTQYCKDNNINLLRLKYDEDYLAVLNNYFKQK